MTGSLDLSLSPSLVLILNLIPSVLRLILSSS